MKKTLLTLAVWSALPLSVFASEPLPYVNPGEDISTVVTQGHGSRVWETYAVTVGNPAFRISQISTSALSDAWLWTPELAVETGKDYEITVSSRVQRDNGTRDFEVYACSDASATAEKQLIVTHRNVKTSFVPYTVYWHCDDASKNRIGFHDICQGYHNYFYLDDIKVREINGRVPAAPTVNAVNTAGKEVTVTVTAPTLDIIGQPVATITRLDLIHSGKVVMSWDNVTPGSVHQFTETVSCLGPQSYTAIGYMNGDAGTPGTGNVTVGGNQSDIQPTLVNQWQPVTMANYKARATYVPGTGCVLTWDAATDEGVTYSVTRVQDGTVLATGLTECTYTDATPLSTELGLYTYKIKKSVNGTESDLYTSTSLSLHNQAPFEAVFSEMALYEYSLYDMDTYDNETWRLAPSISTTYHDRTVGFSARCNDDWLISPGIDLEAGKTYSIDVELLSNSIVESMVGFELFMGDVNNPEGQTTELIPYNMFNSLLAVPSQIFIKPEENRQVFFGIHAKNPVEGQSTYNDIALTRFAVSEVPPTLPAMIDDLNVVFSADDPTQASLTFTAPTSTVSGAVLEQIGRIDVTRDGQLVQSFPSPQPGQALSCGVTVPLGNMEVYTVTPYTVDGQAGPSAKIEVFIITPPYTNSFDSKSDMTGFSYECAYITGYSWGYQAQAMRAYPSMDNQLDDYLFTPPVHLEGGKYYKVDFLTFLGKDNFDYSTTSIELLMGTSPNAASMTTQIIEPYLVTGGFGNKTLLKDYFTVPETGEYYLSWHAYSPKGNADELYIDDIHISDKIEPDVPGAATGLTISPDSEGALKAVVEFDLPTKSISGQDLGYNVYKYEIYRDGRLVKNGYPASGDTHISFTDQSNIMTGVHLYTVICYKDNNTAGREIEDVAYVGINRPAQVPFVEAVEYDDIPGKVHITWAAPETDMNGFPLNTTNITYTVGRFNADLITGEYSEAIFADNVTATEYDGYALTSNEDQQFCRFFVRPRTTAGESPTTLLTHFISVGTPYEMPLIESFVNYRPAIALMSQTTGDHSPAAWGFNSVNPITNVGPVDDDNGQAIMEVLGIGGGSRLFTGRVHITGEHPQLTFYVYNQTRTKTDENLLDIEVREGNGEFVSVACKSVDEWTNHHLGWHKAVVDLTPFVGKNVYIGFNATCVTHTFTHIDRVMVADAPQYDMGIDAIEHPEVFAGVDHDVTVTIHNYGASDSGDYTLYLMCDGNRVGVATGTALAAGQSEEVVFTNSLGREAVGRHVYTAVITHANDADALNNDHTANSFYLFDNNFPTVGNLMAEDHGTSMELTWDAPVLPTQAMEVTDDLESYVPWTTMHTDVPLGHWTLLDLDKGAVGGFQNFEMPNVPINSKQSFYLMDTSDPFFAGDTHYRAHSGNLVLVSSFNTDDSYPDDVLISPELSGQAQTISFWAKSLSDEYPEWFRVAYSTTDMAQTSFTRVESGYYGYQARGDWQLFTFDLPEGAKYFEIEHISNTGYFMFVDDLTFTPAGDERLNLAGYNVYVDADKLTDAPVAETAWSHVAPADGNHTYAVSAVYDRGESPAAEVYAIYTGVDGQRLNTVSVSAGRGNISVRGAEGLDVTVTDAAGLVLCDMRARDNEVIPAAPGVYIVTVASRTFKVIVK